MYKRQAFKAKDVSRIVLTRPAVEAGEKLGFLPGDLQQKVDPYLRPLYDGLFDMPVSYTHLVWDACAMMPSSRRGCEAVGRAGCVIDPSVPPSRARSAADR